MERPKPLTPAPATPASASVDAGTTVQVVELDMPDARFDNAADLNEKKDRTKMKLRSSRTSKKWSCREAVHSCMCITSKISAAVRAGSKAKTLGGFLGVSDRPPTSNGQPRPLHFCNRSR